MIGFGGIHRDREADALRLHTWLPGRRLPLADLLIILLFAAYPAAFAELSVAFLRAFHLVLAGIALRGAAFVFRTYRTHIGGAPRTWGCVFDREYAARRSWGPPLVRPRPWTACGGRGSAAVCRRSVAVAVPPSARCAHAGAVRQPGRPVPCAATRGNVREDFRRRGSASE